MLKPPVDKAQLRRELDRQMREYLREGGQVREIPRGISGRNPADGPLPPAPLIAGEAREDRTYLVEVINAIEARRKPAPMPSARPRRPKKKLIYDDFGEPLRWTWEE